jgi:hypothetical protein
MPPHTATDELLAAAKRLRAAQRRYMSVRGHKELPRAIIEEYGQDVALAASELDLAIEKVENPDA